ncbi:MAG: hypothetical protein K1X64_12320 [Myxococcaceae bacterium]|nr:hypothetical protein [Myxococcaceae bacterium]
MSHPSASKRQKEIARLERRKAKEADRAQRREDRSNRPVRDDGVDPDIAHIIPGPQPVLE